MRTPPSTRTKDDANKELHEIELKINVAKTALERVAAERAAAEEGFATREKRCKDIEDSFGEAVRAADEKIKNSEQIIKLLDIQIAKSTESLHTIDALKAGASSEFEDQKDYYEQKTRNLESIVAMCESNITVLNKEIKDKTDYVALLTDYIQNLHSRVMEVIKVYDDETLAMEEKRGKINEESIALENKKSDIRILSVRFHKQWGSVMAPNQKALTTVE